MPLKRTPTEKDVELLLTFLADPNERTVDLAKSQLRTILRNHPDYGRFLERPADSRLAHEAKLILEEARLEGLEQEFRRLGSQGAKLDLEEGACLLAQLAYPGLDRADIGRQLDRMAEEVEQIFDAEEPAPSQAVGLLRRYFFEELGFHGNQESYYDADNSFVNRVLERRTGIPISLSCVYLLVAWRLDMVAYGIGLPGHFIVGHALPPGVIYLDPFRGGRLLTRNDCIELVHQRGLQFQEPHLAFTTNNQILARMIVNLVTLYTEQGLSERARWLTRLVPLLKADP